VDEVAPFLYGVTPEEVDAAYRTARGVHLLRDADDLPHWRAIFPDATIFWEPGQAFMVAEHADSFRAGLAHIDIVSPNLLEAQQVYGLADPAALVGAMLDDGARIAALRMGAADRWSARGTAMTCSASGGAGAGDRGSDRRG